MNVTHKKINNNNKMASMTIFEENISFAPPHPDGLFAKIYNCGHELFIDIHYEHFRIPISLNLDQFVQMINKEIEIRKCIEKCDTFLEKKLASHIQYKCECFKEFILFDDTMFYIKVMEKNRKTYVYLYYDECIMEKDLFLQLLDKASEILQVAEKIENRLIKKNILVY